MYHLTDIENAIDTNRRLLLQKLSELQNSDGGFKGYYCHDDRSGVWSTAEIVHLVAKTRTKEERADWLRAGAGYIARAQHSCQRR